MTVDIIWKKIAVTPIEVSLNKVLRCGQSFRWKNINNTWSFTTHDRIILLKQDESHIHYSWIMQEGKNFKSPKVLGKETHDFIQDYFNLSINLELLYKTWIQADSKYKRQNFPFEQFKGIRILRQDPWECLISFICSSNNNVKRISKMCDNLVNEFGNFINEYEGIKYYSFPTPQSLSQSQVETKLRNLGFGYRAKYIYQTALKFIDNEIWPDITIDKLYQMRNYEYEQAHDFLLQLSGVGPKVADCICLMALDKHDCVPIDTHVYQIAIRDYKFKGGKTLTKPMYHKIRIFFKDIFGDYAGWAQSVLFTSDLTDLNNGINQIVEIKEETRTKRKLEIKEETRTKRKLEIKEEISIKKLK